MTLTTSDFDFPLDSEQIAQSPADQRDHSRLLLLDRSTGEVTHRKFFELGQLLGPGDLLILNDTRVLPAKFVCRRQTGGKVEGLFLRETQTGQWEVMLKNAGKCAPGEELSFESSDRATLCLDENLGKGRWRVVIEPPLSAEDLLTEAGSTPLPPYIHRNAGQDDSADPDRYQTVYASRSGAVAAPTAGMHFTDSLLGELLKAGIATAHVTLHVGLGTFWPVKTDQLSAHEMHSEWYDLPAETAEKINQTKQAGGRIVAVGTTSVRVLETLAADDGKISPGSGWTDIFIFPPAKFKLVDAMITNFHLPKSTLLMLVAAFCCPGSTDGVEMILAAYRQAIAQDYRFYSYGDAMLIL